MNDLCFYTGWTLKGEMTMEVGQGLLKKIISPESKPGTRIFSERGTTSREHSRKEAKQDKLFREPRLPLPWPQGLAAAASIFFPSFYITKDCDLPPCSSQKIHTQPKLLCSTLASCLDFAHIYYVSKSSSGGTLAPALKAQECL